MIINTVLRKDRLIFQTEAVRHAGLLKAGLAGKGATIHVAPYGKSVNVVLAGNELKLTKPNDEAFAYEEVRCVVQKIHLFGTLSKPQADHILETARRTLDAGLTLFYPDALGPYIELACAYNWISFGFNSKQFKNIEQAIREVVIGRMGATTKVLSNNEDTISIHNYSMFGIVLERPVLEALADIFITHKLVKLKEREPFITRAFACVFRSVLFMEAHQLMDNPSRDLSMQAILEEDILGRSHSLKPLMDAVNIMLREGCLEGLAEIQLGMLHELAGQPQKIDEFANSRVVKEQVTAFVSGFGKDALEILRKKGVAPA